MTALTNVPTTWHVYMPIKAAEAETDAALEDMFHGTAAQTRANLAIMKASGLEVISAAGCDNKDDKGYCLGHPSEGDS